MLILLLCHSQSYLLCSNAPNGPFDDLFVLAQFPNL